MASAKLNLTQDKHQLTIIVNSTTQYFFGQINCVKQLMRLTSSTGSHYLLTHKRTHKSSLHDCLCLSFVNVIHITLSGHVQLFWWFFSCLNVLVKLSTTSSIKLLDLFYCYHAYHFCIQRN